MNKIFLASTMLAAMTGLAAAADLPSRMAPPVYAPPPVPVFTWTGAYFGINAGYAFDHEGRTTVTALTPAAVPNLANGNRPTFAKANSDGFTGGGQIGYNYEFGGFGAFGGPGSGIVVGIEADAAYTDLSHTSTYLGTLNNPSTFHSGLDYLGTVRGRLGYAFGQFLIYGTGGFAYGGVNNSVNFYNGATGALVNSGSTSRMNTGYAYGGGIEYALPTSSFLNFFKSSAVTIKAEYLHYDLGKTTVRMYGANAPFANNYNASVNNSGDLARIGLNYKFGSY